MPQRSILISIVCLSVLVYPLTSTYSAPTHKELSYKHTKQKKKKKWSLKKELRRLRKGLYSMTKRAQTYLLDDLDQVKFKVLVDLYPENKPPVGYALIYVSTISPLRRLGFKENDVILSVNGYKVNSMLRAMAVYYKLRYKTYYAVRILRKGKVHSIRVKVLSRRKGIRVIQADKLATVEAGQIQK
ncbi:MAG: hypothetical protein CL920_29520 [Deltaproteobacteria bacterium]|nr:hypothetical protein [Deltaproteobacteria bacterium]MBU52852.1 hypothetical protein [Deltaproteobacteria bacterium]